MGGKGSKIDPQTYDFTSVPESARITGVEISDVCSREGTSNMIPLGITVIMDFLEANITTNEIFKRDGAKTDCNELNYRLDTGALRTVADMEGTDPHVAVAILKKYIRSLPGGLLPYDTFSVLGDEEDQNALVAAMVPAIGEMQENRQYLYFHTARLLNLAMTTIENAMGLMELTQVFRMNLMDLADPSAAAKFTERAKRVCDATIQRFGELFDAGKYPKWEAVEEEGGE